MFGNASRCVLARAGVIVCGFALVACVETAAPRSRAAEAADSGSLFADAQDFGPAKPANGAALERRDSGGPAMRVLPSDRGQGGARALGAGGQPATGAMPESARAADGGAGDVSSVARSSNWAAADGGTASGVAPAQAGALVISELMVDPKAVSDSEGEWFELYNPGAEPLDLAGCLIADGSAQSHSIAVHAALPPHGYVSVARGEQPGFVPDVVSTFSLKNGADVLELVCGGVTIDRVEYDKARGFPVATGVAMSLDVSNLDASKNDVGEAWCLAVQGYGTDLGTPGIANPACRGEDDAGADP